MKNEVRLFSEAIKDQSLLQGLRQGSVSEADAKVRIATYSGMYSKYVDNRDAYLASTNTFSGNAELSIQQNQYFNATITSAAKSFAGFLSIERDLEAPIALAYWMDLLDAYDNHSVMPNVGPDTLTGIKSRITSGETLTAPTYAYSWSTAKRLIPGSVKLTLITNGVTIATITDDRQTHLITIPGILLSGSVNYETGKVDYELVHTYTFGTNTNMVYVAVEDTAGSPALGSVSGTYGNRFKVQMGHVQMETEADMLIAEGNLAAYAAMNKVLKQDLNLFTQNKLVELYTKLINALLVNTLNNGYVGSTHTIDLGALSYDDYQSGLHYFGSQLIEIESMIATKSYKGLRATSYVGGRNVVDQFRKCSVIGSFVDATDNVYINDLVGYYKGVPVLRHSDLGDNIGYAVHKTPGGEIAPTLRGIFLPLTNTPAVGNYNNPTQVANGVYYQEGVKTIYNELVQKFELELGS